MIPAPQIDGNLPQGIHRASWQEFVSRYGTNQHRLRLLDGLHKALRVLKTAGCDELYMDGSFVSTKELPNDFDGVWSMNNVDLVLLKRLEPVFFEFGFSRAAQKAKFLGELFPAEMQEGNSGKPFLAFFSS